MGKEFERDGDGGVCVGLFERDKQRGKKRDEKEKEVSKIYN